VLGAASVATRVLDKDHHFAVMGAIESTTSDGDASELGLPPGDASAIAAVLRARR
jgi:hypothetical protein